MAKRNTTRNKNQKQKHKYLLAVLAPFLLPAIPLAAQSIDATGDVIPTPGPSPWDAGIFVFFVGKTGDGTLTIADGGQVTSFGSYIGDDPGSTGTVFVDGIGSTWTTTGWFMVGNRGAGELHISNGGTVSNTDGYTYLGFWGGAAGLATVDGEGSTWTNNQLAVGFNGYGELHITNGGIVSDDSGGIYNNSTVTIDGIGSAWNNDYYLSVYGILTITNGGQATSEHFDLIGGTVTVEGIVDGIRSTIASSNFLYVGHDAPDANLIIRNGGFVTSTGFTAIGCNGSGTITVDGEGAGATFTNNGPLYVGWMSNADCALHIKNGGQVINSADASIGCDASSTGIVTVDGESSSWSNGGQLYVGDYGAGELHITDGGTVTSWNALLGIRNNANGSVTVSGTGSSWTTTEEIYVGITGSGSMTITEGGQVNSKWASIGEAYFMGVMGSGSVTVDGPGSEWNNAQTLYVGRDGSGSLTITGGGAVNNAQGIIGDTRFGTVIVDGEGSTWTNREELYIGYWGKGELHITGGGTVNCTDAHIGSQSGSSGIVTVDGTGSTWNTGGYGLTVGNGGNGELHISNGGKVYSTVGDVGVRGSGIVTVDGIGSEWINSEELWIERGELTITNGAYVGNTDGYICAGIVTVDGTGSAWSNAGEFDVGYWGGTGTLAITNGGLVTNSQDFSIIGYSATGTVTVDGVGATGIASAWTNSGNLYIAYAEWTDPDWPESYAVGTLTITNGGQVTNADAFIAYHGDGGMDAIGIVNVDGQGSTWNNTGSLCIGYDSTGTLTISNGGLVTADNATFLANGLSTAWDYTYDDDTKSGVWNERLTAAGILNIGAASGDDAVAPGSLETPFVAFGLGSGKIVFNHTDVSGDYVFSPAIINMSTVDSSDSEENFPSVGSGGGGGGGGSSVDHYAGFTVFTGSSSYTVPTNIYGGTFAAGDDYVFSPNSHHTIHAEGTLNLQGHHQILSNITNHGLIKTGGNTQSGSGAALIITGDYIGEDGIILLNTKLGDDTSPTDRLLIDGGSVTGHTFLQINNTDGLGAQTKGNGILLIATANGGSTDPDSFTLDGEVKAGAFEYTLHHGGVEADAANDEWYLRSEGGTRIEVPVDVAVATLAPRIGRSMVGTFFSRVGSASNPDMGRDTEQPIETDSEHANLFWVRVFGETGRGGDRGSDGEGGGGGNFGFGKNGPEYTFNYGGTQIGSDLYRSETDTLGLYLGFSTLQSKIKDIDGNHAGKVTMDALTLGGYWTHYSPTGWYTDIVLQADWYSTICSKSAAGEEFSTNGLTLTASAEIGYVIELGNGLNLIPQTQFVYQYTSIQNGSDSFARIQYSATNQFYGRLGGRLSQTLSTTGLTAWLEANFWHQFETTAKTTFSALDGSNPTTISTQLGATWAQAVLGISAPINKHLTIFATADYNIGLDQSSHSFGGQLGIKIGW